MLSLCVLSQTLYEVYKTLEIYCQSWYFETTFCMNGECNSVLSSHRQNVNNFYKIYRFCCLNFGRIADLRYN